MCALKPLTSRTVHHLIETVDDAEARLRELNALEGFERWRLKVLPDGKYQVLELDASGKARWQSFRKENIRIVVGWAAQQTNKRFSGRLSNSEGQTRSESA